MNLPSAFLSIATSMSAAFGAPFFDGLILSQETPGGYDGNGDYQPGTPGTPRPCKVQIDVATEAMRQADGFTDGDVRFIILAASFTGTLDTDARVQIESGPRAGTWMVSSLERDPAGIGWAGKGRLA